MLKENDFIIQSLEGLINYSQPRNNCRYNYEIILLIKTVTLNKFVVQSTITINVL